MTIVKDGEYLVQTKYQEQIYKLIVINSPSKKYMQIMRIGPGYWGSERRWIAWVSAEQFATDYEILEVLSVPQEKVAVPKEEAPPKKCSWFRRVFWETW